MGTLLSVRPVPGKDAGHIMKESEGLTLFYGGDFSLCAREIAFCWRQEGADRLSWVDVSGGVGDDVGTGLTREQALARFHMMDDDVRLVSGGSAFTRDWEALPHFLSRRTTPSSTSS